MNLIPAEIVAISSSFVYMLIPVLVAAFVIKKLR